MSLPDAIRMTFNVDGDDFAAAGTASSEVKRALKQLGMPPELVKRAAICMYEGEINMVIHADGGVASVAIRPGSVEIELRDRGPGIPDLELAMQEGYSTASEQARNLGFGAGMGLPNMKRYADELKIDTKIGVGTTVTMVLRDRTR